MLLVAVIFLFLVSTTSAATEDIGIYNEVDLDVATSSRITLLGFLLSLGTFVFTAARQLLNRQDHHTFRTHWFRKPRVFAPTEAAVREDEEEVGDKEEREDRQYIKGVERYRSLWGWPFLRFNCLRFKVSR